MFVYSGATWTEQQELRPFDIMSGDEFGGSVSISGDTIVVGANGANSDQGSAYVFVRSGATWTQQKTLTALDGAPIDRFGASVSISGNTIVAGPIGVDVGANSSQGSAYVFVRSGTTWTQQQKLTASDGAALDQLGIAVAITGDTVVVGTNSDDVGTNTDQGSAYVFVRSGTTWTQQQKLTASDGAASGGFGVSVGIVGNTIIVGATGEVGANSSQESAYVFVRSGTTWTQQQKLTAHGSTNVWRSLFTTEDAQVLNDQQSLSLFVTMTCLNGFFQDPVTESLAEGLLRSERGGAVAVWASSGLTAPGQQAVMNQQAYRLLFAGGNGLTIGEVTSRAKGSVSNTDIRRTWILFGDPTTRLIGTRL